MRLIDADALKKCFFRPYSNEEYYTNVDIEEIIDAQPTVEQVRECRYKDRIIYGLEVDFEKTKEIIKFVKVSAEPEKQWIPCSERLPEVGEDVLDKIKSEITAIVINGQIDEHTAFIRTGEQVKQMMLDVIDKYKEGSEDKE